MSAFAHQGFYSGNLESCFNYLGVSDTSDHKSYLSNDIHPFYPLGVNVASSESLEPRLWNSFVPETFNDIDAFTLPNTFETMLDVMQASGAVDDMPAKSVQHEQTTPSGLPIAPFSPSNLEYLQNDYQYIGKHPTELESSELYRIEDPKPEPLAGSPDNRSLSQNCDHLTKPIDSKNHPPAKRLPRSRLRNAREPYATATAMATRSSQSKPRIRKATSFNCSSSSSHASRKTRSIAKSKSVPHMPNNVTSNPREEHAPGHRVSLSLTKEKFAFVNYTMEDKEEIIAAVAPSGTMKTRARREQEAREEALRIKEAALAAIRRAGGDPKDLRLFMH